LNYTRRGFRLKGGRLHLAGDIVLTVVWSRHLPAEPTTTSDAHDLPHPGHGRKAAQRLARYQRMMARRRRKGQVQSKGYRTAQARAAKLHKKITRQREDTARQWAKRAEGEPSPGGSGRAGRVVIPARRGMASNASDRHERRPSGLA
jgi:putative transposase